MTKRQAPRRTYRGGLARANFIWYCSAYRRAAREYGIGKDKFFAWLATFEYRDKPGIHTGAGLLAYTACRQPVDPHDAALRTLAGFAPGLGLDKLQQRQRLSEHGVRWPASSKTPTMAPGAGEPAATT